VDSTEASIGPSRPRITNVGVSLESSIDAALVSPVGVAPPSAGVGVRNTGVNRDSVGVKDLAADAGIPIADAEVILVGVDAGVSLVGVDTGVILVGVDAGVILVGVDAGVILVGVDAGVILVFVDAGVSLVGVGVGSSPGV